MLGAIAAGAAAVMIERAGVSPRLLEPYIERHTSGHHPLIEATGRHVATLLVWLDRGSLQPRLDWPAWALPRSSVSAPRQASAGREVLVADNSQLVAALAQAQPGDAIRIAPGTYRFSGRSLRAERPGRAEAPITVTAAVPGSVTLEFDLLEGFLVAAPHWIFEQLTIAGVCRNDDDCEHAFHVVADADHVTIRDNELRDFNAHLKINGAGGQFPDHGMVSGNRIFNTRARRTDRPVTLIDLVAASGWRIEGNLIADFVKAGGNATSYGAFAKGAGTDNRFERNVVLCEHRLRGAAGRRIGRSFGGGGTGKEVCRDRRCTVEHERGVIENNLIASCSDVGIYLNRAAQSVVRHNTLIDAAGIQASSAETAARVEGNLLDADLWFRHGAILRAADNRSTPQTLRYLGLSGAGRSFMDAATLDLRWRNEPERRVLAAGESSSVDLCGQVRPDRVAYGAFEDIRRCEQDAHSRRAATADR